MSERLTDEELADVAARIEDPRCCVCEGRGLVPVSPNASVDCRACDGTGHFALSTRTMSSIVEELVARRIGCAAQEKVVQAAKEWRAFDLAHEKHDAYGPLFHKMKKMLDAIDALTATKES